MPEQTLPPPPVSGADPSRPALGSAGRRHAYWVANIRVVASLLVVWAAVSFGCGILLAKPLNHVHLPGSGFPLGFWFAQQGSIYVFVVLIFVYVWIMNRLDRKFGVREA
ncbi:MAG: DUF4212 domain-containing protein [Phycisphaerales bacterium]|nr:DUF4212 domain-containing protein [Phycisphaerales bacterium]